MDEATAFVDEVWRDGARPEPAMTVSQWADQHRMLPPTAAEPGPWRTSRTPYMRAIMDDLSPSSPVERVVFMKGAQIAATEGGLNWLGFVIDHAPGVMLLVMPTHAAVKRNTRLRIDPMIASCPRLSSRVAPVRSRAAGNTVDEKQFPGGALMMVGANSGVGLRSTPARYVFLDEVDAYPLDVSGEGDPVSLAIDRTTTFRGRRKIFMASTPTIKGLSRIEAAYLESDQRRYFIHCLGCGEANPIMWADIRWPAGERRKAAWCCPPCGAVHREAMKPRLLRDGLWRPTAPGDGVTHGYHLSALYSPFVTWAEIAREHDEVRRDPPRLKTWTNNKLAEPIEDMAGEAVESDSLMARREDWGDRLPEAVAVLTAGVDVQNDRLELHVTGWGRDEESWSIAYRVIWGDPSGARVWADLDVALAETWAHPKAVPDMPIRAVAVDTGGKHTAAAYGYCSARFSRRIWGVKGRSAPGLALWPRRPSRSKSNTPIFIVGVDAAKDAIMARLRLSGSGPGAMHFPLDRDAEFFRQLTAEKVVTRYGKGRPVRQWLPKQAGGRNEALDTTVYAYAALHGLIAAGMRLNDEALAVERALPRAAGQTRIAAAPVIPAVSRSTWMQF